METAPVNNNPYRRPESLFRPNIKRAILPFTLILYCTHNTTVYTDTTDKWQKCLAPGQSTCIDINREWTELMISLQSCTHLWKHQYVPTAQHFHQKATKESSLSQNSFYVSNAIKFTYRSYDYGFAVSCVQVTSQHSLQTRSLKLTWEAGRNYMVVDLNANICVRTGPMHIKQKNWPSLTSS